MLKNKENFLGQMGGDRFIPTQVRSCASRMESNLMKEESTNNNYEELLGKSILQPSDSKASNKIMSFGAKNNNSHQDKENYNNCVDK